MSVSPNPDHVEVAQVLQDKLYYDAETLEISVNLLKKFSSQSSKYLDAITHLAFVLLRMLEKFSKSKAYMFVRRKKANRGGARRKKAMEEEEGDGIGQGDEEEEEVEASALSFKEHQFEMAKFEDKFVDEAVLATYITFLASYPSFTSPEQTKRIVNLLHRIAVKAKCEALLFKPSVFLLFQQILDDPRVTASQDPACHDLRRLVEFVLRRFFKVAKQHPMLMLEIFFPKSTSRLTAHRDAVIAADGSALVDPYASSDEDGLPAVLAKGNADVEVQPGFSLSQQIGIAMRCLTDAGQLELIGAVQDNLRLAAAARTEIVLGVDGDTAAQDSDDGSDEALRRKALRLSGPSDAAKAKFEPIKATFSEEQREQASSNKHFRLLLRLLQWTSHAPDPDQPLSVEWTIPALLMPNPLEGDLHIIDGFLADPVDPHNGKSAADLLRKLRKPVVRKRRARLPTSELEELGDSSEGEPVIGEDGQPVPRVKKARKKAVRKPRQPRGEGEGGGEGGRKRQKRQKEEQQYRSAQFIDDSDMDEEADAAFFAREQELRAMMNSGAIRVAPMEGGKAAAPGKKGKGKGKAPARKGKVMAPRHQDFVVSDVSDVSDLESAPRSAAESDEEMPSAASSGEARKRGRSVSDASEASSPVVSKKALFNPPTQEEQSEGEDVVSKVKRRKAVEDSEED